jgi:hypothetical protein
MECNDTITHRKGLRDEEDTFSSDVYRPVGRFAPGYADDDAAIVTGAGGAVTGAIVGGPVGAVIGGALGMIAGASLNPPPKEVVTYIEERPAPAQKYVVKETIVVGNTLPDDVVLETVPDNDAYAYTVINDRRVVVQRDNRAIVKIIE